MSTYTEFPGVEDLVTIEVTWSRSDLEEAVTILRRNAWSLTVDGGVLGAARAIELAIENLPEPEWQPDAEQVAAYQAANIERLGYGTSPEYAIDHLRSLHGQGLRL